MSRSLELFSDMGAYDLRGYLIGGPHDKGNPTISGLWKKGSLMIVNPIWGAAGSTLPGAPRLSLMMSSSRSSSSGSSSRRIGV